LTIRKAYADLPAGQLHYAHAGGTGPALVFFHQTASSWAMWAKVIGLLEDLGAPVYAFDTPGFGGSFNPEGRTSLPQYAGWMAAAIDMLGVGPAHIIGHHTGAAITCQLAADRPDLVRTATMIGPVTMTTEEREKFRGHAGPPFVPEATGSYVTDNWNYLAAGGATADPLLINREMSDAMRAHVGRSQAYNAVWDQDFTGLFTSLRCPLHILCAPGDDLWPFFERARELRPDAEATALPGGGNFEPDLEPVATADAIRAFLKRHG
jgi:pimeloyl-ACP methyl ester carboxylesterase